MSLEQFYWIAGVVVAIVAVVNLVKWRREKAAKNIQKATVLGSDNKVSQKVSTSSKRKE